ncbi:MAG: hypothetical protein AUG09_05105 [Acidobacteria bacterium 13_1_20CM_2_68_7]|nr:MAG: hypothetical protein AUG09_05105 [Acidobacteria bacterium 13_1_20CM_2_68_7]
MKVPWTWQGKPGPQSPTAETVRLAPPLNPTTSAVPASTSEICQEQAELELTVLLLRIVTTVSSVVPVPQGGNPQQTQPMPKDVPSPWIEK